MKRALYVVVVTVAQPISQMMVDCDGQSASRASTSMNWNPEIMMVAFFILVTSKYGCWEVTLACKCSRDMRIIA